MKEDKISSNRIGKRVFLNDSLTSGLMETIDLLFYKMVEIPRIKHGKKQSIETLINEEALLLAKYLRGNVKHGFPEFPLFKTP